MHRSRDDSQFMLAMSVVDYRYQGPTADQLARLLEWFRRHGIEVHDSVQEGIVYACYTDRRIVWYEHGDKRLEQHEGVLKLPDDVGGHRGDVVLAPGDSLTITYDPGTELDVTVYERNP